MHVPTRWHNPPRSKLFACKFIAYPKRCVYLLSVLLFLVSAAVAQEQKIADSLSRIYEQQTLPDTARFVLLRDLAFNEVRDLKRALKFAEELISLSESTGNTRYLGAGYFLKGTKQRLLGNLDEALGAFFKSAEVAKKLRHATAEGDSYGAVADIYSTAKDHPNASSYYNKSITTLRQANDSISLASALLNAGDELLRIRKYDSALLYFKEAEVIFGKVNYRTGIAYSLGNIGMVYAANGQHSAAEKNMNEAIRILEETQDYQPICDYLVSISNVYLERGNVQTALGYALRSFQLAKQFGLKEQVANASLGLSNLYERTGNINLSFDYYKQHIAYRDSINDINNVQRMADLRTNFLVAQKQVELNMVNRQKRNERNLNILLGVILGLTMIILVILLRNNKHKQKAFKILQVQKQETDKQKAKAEDALTELQVTQKQLIHTAKMASLGELTAGIAHEIQNPLNFVNNFSELSVELLGELRGTSLNKLAAADRGEAVEIVRNLEENLGRISLHGKKADSIVKGMLQHSRSSSGQKEPTDINALADEFLRLSYHGLKVKDKSFDADFVSEFDASVGKITIVPQDIGRVLLNLYNNAFYAVHKKTGVNGEPFKPLVSVSTKRIGHMVELSVKDNGIGIPQHVIDKIFQPFFTTKPTGQGTGLGLSLSYDIIKAHGGEITVQSVEGLYTEFTIQLPG